MLGYRKTKVKGRKQKEGWRQRSLGKGYCNNPVTNEEELIWARGVGSGEEGVDIAHDQSRKIWPFSPKAPLTWPEEPYIRPFTLSPLPPECMLVSQTGDPISS